MDDKKSKAIAAASKKLISVLNDEEKIPTGKTINRLVYYPRQIFEDTTKILSIKGGSLNGTVIALLEKFNRENSKYLKLKKHGH